MNDKLWEAAGNGDVRAVVECFEDPNNSADVDEKHLDLRFTALYRAAQNGYLEIVKLLLDKGADPNAITKDNCTALQTAAERGYREIVELLLDKGANLDDRMGNGKTALHLAAENGRREIVELLLDRGANINNKTETGLIIVFII